MIGWLIDVSAKNRALVLFAAIALAIAGVTAMRNVKLDAIPDLSDPQVIVFTEWMGRSPTLVEDQVTYPLVTSLLGAPHVVDVRGQTMFGMSFVYVVFEEGTDLSGRALGCSSTSTPFGAGSRQMRTPASARTRQASVGYTNMRSSIGLADTTSGSSARCKISRFATH